MRAIDRAALISGGGRATAYTAGTMAIKVSTSEKKAEIARDVVVAYISHVDKDELKDLDALGGAIARLVDVVDHTFEVPEKANTGFGLSPSLPRPTA